MRGGGGIGLVLWILLAILPIPLHAAPLQVTGMEFALREAEETLTLTLSEKVSYRAFTLQGPARIVVDLPPFQWRVPAEQFQAYHGRLVRNLRYARFDAETSRVVLDLAQPVTLAEPSGGEPSDHIMLTLKPMPGAVSAAPPPHPLVAEDMTEALAKRLPALTPPMREPTQAIIAPPLFERVPTPAAKPSVQAAVARPEKPLIVIDAGHGGQDPGATGAKGTLEKRVTLDYARALRHALIATGRFRADLTRDGDYFILLRERIRIAKQKGANLFVSLHADALPGKAARGLSLYTLSEDASDEEAAALATKENKADVLAEVDLSHQQEDVAEILIDLAQRDTQNKSLTLADSLVTAMPKSGVPLLKNPHRVAGFAVLKAPDIPSTLIEIGFLSTPEEEQQLLSPRHREKVIQGIVRGIKNYFAGVGSGE